MTRLQTQVAAFMREFNQPIAPAPSIPSKEVVALRARLVVEEVFEMMEALYGKMPEWDVAQALIRDVMRVRTPRVDLSKLADAFGDIDYVVEGARLAFGIEGGAVADAIHVSNMEKVGGQRRGDGKQLKPAQWQPPDVAGILAGQAERIGDLAKWVEGEEDRYAGVDEGSW
jgi:predicted HAD superfamily Cof-like phosphohydrolase